MAADEALRVLLIGGRQHRLAVLLRLVGEAEVQRGRRQQADSGVTVFIVVAGEKPLAKGPSILDGAEAVGAFGALLHGAELAFRIRVVVGDVRTGMRLGDAEIGQQKRHRL